MTRIRGHHGEEDIAPMMARAMLTGRHVYYARVRCEHGYTSDQRCRACEGGYVQDTSPYAKLRGDVEAVALTDDLEAVVYLKRGK